MYIPKNIFLFYLEKQRADSERQARLNVILQLREMGLSIEQIAQALSLSLEEVENYY